MVDRGTPNPRGASNACARHHDPRPVRQAGAGHRRQRRHRARHRDAPRTGRRRGAAAGAEPGEGRGRGRDDPGGRTRCLRRPGSARPVVPGVRGGARRAAERRGRTDRRPDRQRGRDDPAGAADHGGRHRAAARDEPPRALRAGRSAAPAAASRSRPDRVPDQRRREPGRDQLGRPQLGAVLQRDARLQRVEDRVRALRPRARAPEPPARMGSDQRPVPPRRRTDEPPVGTTRARQDACREGAGPHRRAVRPRHPVRHRGERGTPGAPRRDLRHGRHRAPVRDPADPGTSVALPASRRSTRASAARRTRPGSGPSPSGSPG